MRSKLKAIIVPLLLVGCASSPSSWEQLVKNNAQPESGYCSRHYKKANEVEYCEVEAIAQQRAQTLCQQDSHPDYCVLMAEYSWKNFKNVIVKGSATKEHANFYPVLCGRKEKAVRPCSVSK